MPQRPLCQGFSCVLSYHHSGKHIPALKFRCTAAIVTFQRQSPYLVARRSLSGVLFGRGGDAVEARLLNRAGKYETSCSNASCDHKQTYIQNERVLHYCLHRRSCNLGSLPHALHCKDSTTAPSPYTKKRLSQTAGSCSSRRLPLDSRNKL